MSEATMVAVPNEYLTRPKPFFYYVGASKVASVGPQGFFAVSNPNEVTRSHFHHVDQFQVFFGDPGSTYQRHEMGSLMVHYADSETVYGPFAAGVEGLRFLTLRRSGSDFTGFMPESRGDLPPKPQRRHCELRLDEWASDPLPTIGESVTDEMFARYDDGLVACKIAAGPGAKLVGLDPNGSGGQYHVVVTGTVIVDQQSFPRYSAAWVQPDSDTIEMVAGDEGARVLTLQFGRDPS